jgi:uncharacterized membrane protein YbhN (UPF0104 family)
VQSIQAFLDAARAFFHHLSEVKFAPLGIAVLLHLTNLTLRTRGWRNILRAAYPDAPIRWRGILGAYVAGVGINAFAPARGGDVVKIFAVRQRIRGSSTPTLVASLLAETVFDFVVASCLMTWAYATGRLPSLPSIPNAPAFEWSFFARHLREVEIGAVVLAILLLFFVRWLARHVRAFWARVQQGLTILRTPRRFLTTVVPYQAVGWCCRLGTAYFLLRAFSVHATITNALLVLVVTAISTLLPVTPGGAGAQQALLVIVLAGSASDTQILAYSVGAQATTTIVNIVIGAIAVFAIFGSVRLGGIRQRAELAHAREPGGSPVVDGSTRRRGGRPDPR